MRRNVLNIAAVVLLLPAVAPAAEKLDLSYIPEDAIGATVAHPRRLMEAPNAELLPLEVFTVACQRHAGFDPHDLEQVVAVVGLPGPEDPDPRFGMILRFNKQLDLPAIAAKIVEQGMEQIVSGHRVRAARRPDDLACAVVDAKTLILAPFDSGLAWILEAKDADKGPLAKAMDAADDAPEVAAYLVMQPIDRLVADMMRQGMRIPPEMMPLVGLPKLINSVSATFHQASEPGGMERLGLYIDCPNEQDARDLEGIIRQMLKMGRAAFLAQAANQSGDTDIDEAMNRYLERVSAKIVEMLQPKRDGARVFYEVELPGSALVAASGTLIGLTLPAVNAAREAANRNASMNRLKQIALAMHNYADQRKAFPSQSIKSKDGKPLLSWRVAILPEIEEGELYQQFRLDEPWDSEHNIKLLDKMPWFYQSPGAFEDATKTCYLLPVGKGTIFELDRPRIGNISDGLSRTILAVEADPSKAVPWTKPGDLEVTADKPIDGLGNMRAGGIFLAVFADGHVESLSNRIKPSTLWTLFTRNGGEPIPHDLDQ